MTSYSGRTNIMSGKIMSVFMSAMALFDILSRFSQSYLSHRLGQVLVPPRDVKVRIHTCKYLNLAERPLRTKSKKESL